MWAETPELAEFQEHAISERRREVTNEVKCKKITECATYDEFREHVAAAFLKPIDTKRQPGKSGSGSSTLHDRHISNIIEKERNDGVCEKLAEDLSTIKVSDVKCPENVFEFETSWRRACKTSQDKVAFLKKIPWNKYRKIFKVQGSLTMLGDIVIALSEGRKRDSGAEYDAFLYSSLRGLSRVKGISMAIAFLEDEMNLCKTLLDALLHRVKKADSDVPFTAEDIEALRDVYLEG